MMRSRDLLTLGDLASGRRLQMLPDPQVTFIVDRNVNYTNVCVSGCRFCAFYRSPGAPDAYLLSTEEILEKARETVALGGTGLMLQGGLHPELPIEWFETLFRELKQRFPQLDLHSLSPPEIVYVARLSGLSVAETLSRLGRAGLDSLPGGGAEILVDAVRRELAPGKATTAEWLEVMREAHRQGMKTTATMMFGSIESVEDRVEHLQQVRALQDETGGFRAFIPWTFQQANTALAGRVAPATAVEYLVTLAVSRLYLDNVPSIQASWVTQGIKIGQVALHFGANDLGSTMIEENVVAAAGVTFEAGIKELVHAIRRAGFIPVQRRSDYSPVRTF
ncbi:MAG: dehypoxanthine futalosine cyclase [Gaiellales bacterium]|nr:dehypoxanthine futalosine cyclase [Gaiellales bacterium]